jgi:hypothetical protein
LSLNHASKRYLAMAAALGVSLSLGHALTPSEQGRLPVQAFLVKAIEAGRVKAGDTVLAKISCLSVDATDKPTAGGIASCVRTES